MTNGSLCCTNATVVCSRRMRSARSVDGLSALGASSSMRFVRACMWSTSRQARSTSCSSSPSVRCLTGSDMEGGGVQAHRDLPDAFRGGRMLGGAVRRHRGGRAARTRPRRSCGPLSARRSTTSPQRRPGPGVAAQGRRIRNQHDGRAVPRRARPPDAAALVQQPPAARTGDSRAGASVTIVADGPAPRVRHTRAARPLRRHHCGGTTCGSPSGRRRRRSADLRRLQRSRSCLADGEAPGPGHGSVCHPRHSS